MPDIEERLRAGLGALAEEVAPSEDPRAGLDRRLAARRRALRRAPALTAAAAAAAVVAVFVPIVASQDSPSTGTQAARTTPAGPGGLELPGLGTVVRGGTACARSATSTPTSTAPRSSIAATGRSR